MRPTQESLFPLIEKYASQYVACLFTKSRKHLLKSLSYSAYSVLIIIALIYVANLGFGDGIENGPLIFRFLGLILFITSVFIVGEFFESLKLYRAYRAKYDIENDWLKSKRHAIVCFNCYERDCPEIDLGFDTEAKMHLYTADYLVEYFYNRHYLRARLKP